MTVETTVYIGPSVSNLLEVIAPDVGSTLSEGGYGTWHNFTFRALEGVTYYFRFSGGVSTTHQSYSASGTISGSYSFQPVTGIPLNDNFSGRLPLTGFTNVVVAGTTNASSEVNEPHPPSLNGACSPAGRSLWWSYTAPQSGMLRVSVTGGGMWAVYRGAALEQLQLQGASCELPVEIIVSEGEVIAIMVDDAGYLPGVYALHTILLTTPCNDNFSDTIRVEGTNVSYVSNLPASSKEPGEPISGYTNTVWFSWAAPCTGRFRFTQGYYQEVRIYTGPKVDMLQPVRFVQRDWGYDFLAIEGTVYHFQISGEGDECLLFFQRMPWVAAPHDAFTSARREWGHFIENTNWFPIAEMTSEPGEPAHVDGAPSKSIWWNWTSPNHGSAQFWADQSLATNVVLAVYQGSSIEALTLLAKGTTYVEFAVFGGESYYVAAATPADTIGDVMVGGGSGGISIVERVVTGNLLREPSWEGTGINNAHYWGRSQTLAGLTIGPEVDACDGRTWVFLPAGAQIWQDISTVPGRPHLVRFALRARSRYVSDSPEDGKVRVLWDGREIGVAILPRAEADFWHWPVITATATGSTSRVTFVNNGGRTVEVDAFSIIDSAQPPQIINQPVSSSVVRGGTAAMLVGASGSLPFNYQWFFNGEPLVSAVTPVLQLDGVSTSQAGTYHVMVSNVFGAATSAPVTLTVEAPTKPVILWQPYGDTVGVGSYFNFAIVAAGSAPLGYQWSRNQIEIVGATNRTLSFESVNFTNTGTYAVRVHNDEGVVWSMGAELTVTNAVEAGAKVYLRNNAGFASARNAPVFDVDKVTPLSGSKYLAQLYAGTTLASLRPVGKPSPFQTGFDAGYFLPQLVTLPNVPSGAAAALQIRAWDGDKGSSYEEARAMGGRFGKSELLNVVLPEGQLALDTLDLLRSFSLQAGLPEFAVGKISLLERKSGAVLVWEHRGEPGFRYLIEKSFSGFEWSPYLVITNETSVTTFSNIVNSGSEAAFYRSRIVD